MSGLEWWEEKYAEFLDDDSNVVVAGLEYTPSRVLQLVDPIAFRCGALDLAAAEGWDTDKAEDEQEDDDDE